MPVTNYVWDPLSDNVLLETDENDVTQAVYTQEPDPFGNLISQRRDDQTSWYHFDGLGSTRELTDDSETVTATNMYDAWGVNVASTGITENPFRWAGEVGYYDDPETGDYYIRARIYCPEIARWLSMDPLMFNDDMQLYLYARNNPILNRDPSGAITVTPRDEFLESAKCGSLVFISWDFELSEKAPCNGFVVQEVTYRCKIAKCRTSEKFAENNVVYYEAWPVAKNRTLSHHRSRIRENGPVVTDTASVQTRENSIGNAEQQGKIRFYCMDKAPGRAWTGNLFRNPKWRIGKPIGIAGGPCSIRAGGLPRTVRAEGEGPPHFWKENPIEGSATRKFSAYWDCCPCGEDVEYGEVIAGAEPRADP